MDADACAACRELISGYMDGELDGTEMARMRAHLEQCADCRAALDYYRDISKSIQSLPKLAPPRALSSSIHVRTMHHRGWARNRTETLGTIAGVSTALLFLFVAGYLAVISYQRSINPAVAAYSAVDNEIRITFNTAMDQESVERALSIQPSSQIDIVDIDWDDNTLILGRNRTLKSGVTYLVKIGPDARDKWGESLSSEFRLSFTTGASAVADETPTGEPQSDLADSSSVVQEDATAVASLEAENVSNLRPTSDTTPAATASPATAEAPVATVVEAFPTAAMPPGAPMIPATPIIDTIPSELPLPSVDATPSPIQTSPSDPVPPPEPVVGEDDDPLAAETPVPVDDELDVAPALPVVPEESTVAPSPTPTATPSPPPSPPLSPTPSPTPLATPSPTPTAADAIVAVSDAFADIYWGNPDVHVQLGEPRSPGTPVAGTLQDFQRGTMIQMGNGDSIRIIVNLGEWRIAEGPRNARVPSKLNEETGLWMPGGVFGVVWRRDRAISEDLGHAMTAEPVAFNGDIQEFAGGTILRVPEVVYVLYDHGAWDFFPASVGE